MTANKSSNIDLVVEVIDALLNPVFDGDRQDAHVDAIICFLQRVPHDPANEDLCLASDVFRTRKSMSTTDFFLGDNTAAIAVAERLKTRLPRWPYYLYHGTVATNLQSIARSGLIPAFGRPVWKKLVRSEHLGRGVFFTTSWRSAINWALAYTTDSDGTQKEGHIVAVIRVLAEPLTFRLDPLARTNDCVIVEGGTPVESAHFVEGPDPGIPDWKPFK